MKGWLFVVAGMLLLCAPPTSAKPERFGLDPEHTQIVFKVSHLGYAHAWGKFRIFRGEFTFDEEDWSRSSVEVIIETRGLDLANRRWNEKIRGEHFLDVEQFPEMRFVSTKVEKTGENTGVISGDLTMLGETRPVTLQMTLNKVGKSPLTNKLMAGFSATGELKRSDWGMTYLVPAAGDTVTLFLEAEGIREK